MKLCLVLVVAALAGFCEANPVKRATPNCDDYAATSNAKFGDLVGKHYIKYMSHNDQGVVNDLAKRVDSSRVEISRIGTSNNFTLMSIMIEKDPKKRVNTTSTLYVDDLTHGVVEDNRGGLEDKYYVTSFKPEPYYLLYMCNPRGGTTSLVRMILTTNITQNVTQALEEDRKHKFSTRLVEFPFNHEDLIKYPLTLV